MIYNKYKLSKKLKKISRKKKGGSTTTSTSIYPKQPRGILYDQTNKKFKVQDINDTNRVDCCKTISFIRGCDMIKDALTGSSKTGGNKISPKQIFEIMAGNNLDGTEFKPTDNYKCPAFKDENEKIHEKEISSLSAGDNIGNIIKDSIIADLEKEKIIIKRKGDDEISKLPLKHIQEFTMDGHVLPHFFKCDSDYVTKNPLCEPLFNPKQSGIGTYKKYFVTVGTLLDPATNTQGELDPNPIKIDNNFMINSGFIAGYDFTNPTTTNEINIDNIGHAIPVKKTDKYTYTFNINNFKICNIDFKVIGCDTDTKLIKFCSESSNVNNAHFFNKAPPLIANTHFLAKECGDTLQAAVLNRTYNDDANLKKRTLFTLDKGTFLSCILYQVPSVLTFTPKDGSGDVCHFFDPITIPNYDELYKENAEIIGKFEKFVTENLKEFTDIYIAILGKKDVKIRDENYKVSNIYINQYFGVSENNINDYDELFNNLFFWFDTPDINQLYLFNQFAKWVNKMYILYIILKILSDELKIKNDVFEGKPERAEEAIYYEWVIIKKIISFLQTDIFSINDEKIMEWMQYQIHEFDNLLFFMIDYIPTDFILPVTISGDYPSRKEDGTYNSIKDDYLYNFHNFTTCIETEFSDEEIQKLKKIVETYKPYEKNEKYYDDDMMEYIKIKNRLEELNDNITEMYLNYFTIVVPDISVSDKGTKVVIGNNTLSDLYYKMNNEWIKSITDKYVDKTKYNLEDETIHDKFKKDLYDDVTKFIEENIAFLNEPAEIIRKIRTLIEKLIIHDDNLKYKEFFNYKVKKVEGSSSFTLTDAEKLINLYIKLIEINIYYHNLFTIINKNDIDMIIHELITLLNKIIDKDDAEIIFIRKLIEQILQDIAVKNDTQYTKKQNDLLLQRIEYFKREYKKYEKTEPEICELLIKKPGPGEEFSTKFDLTTEYTKIDLDIIQYSFGNNDLFSWIDTVGYDLYASFSIRVDKLIQQVKKITHDTYINFFKNMIENNAISESEKIIYYIYHFLYRFVYIFDCFIIQTYPDKKITTETIKAIKEPLNIIQSNEFKKLFDYHPDNIKTSGNRDRVFIPEEETGKKFISFYDTKPVIMQLKNRRRARGLRGGSTITDNFIIKNDLNPIANNLLYFLRRYSFNDYTSITKIEELYHYYGLSINTENSVKMEDNHNKMDIPNLSTLDYMYNDIGIALLLFIRKTYPTKEDINKMLFAIHIMVSLVNDDLLDNFPLYYDVPDKPIEEYINEKYKTENIRNTTQPGLALYLLFGKDIYDTLCELYYCFYVREEFLGFNIYRIIRWAIFNLYENERSNINRLKKYRDKEIPIYKSPETDPQDDENYILYKVLYYYHESNHYIESLQQIVQELATAPHATTQVIQMQDNGEPAQDTPQATLPPQRATPIRNPPKRPRQEPNTPETVMILPPTPMSTPMLNDGNTTSPNESEGSSGEEGGNVKNNQPSKRSRPHGQGQVFELNSKGISRGGKFKNIKAILRRTRRKSTK
jgi:hypothetical protein